MTLHLRVTLSNIDRSQADDEDRILVRHLIDTVVLQLCGHKNSKVQFCIDEKQNTQEILDHIARLSGGTAFGGDLHLGVSNRSAIGSPLIVVPIVNGVKGAEFSLSDNIVLFEPATVYDSQLAKGLSLIKSAI